MMVEGWLAAAEEELRGAAANTTTSRAERRWEGKDQSPFPSPCGGLLACEGPPVTDWETGESGGKLRVCWAHGDQVEVEGSSPGGGGGGNAGAAATAAAVAAMAEAVAGEVGNGTLYSLFAYPAYDNYAGESVVGVGGE